MEHNLFFKAIVLGFSIAAPVGPIGILCIQRTLQFGRFSGLFSGLGAAVADTLYGIIAAFGMAMISNFLIKWEIFLHLIGGVILIYMGVKTFFKKPAEKMQNVAHITLIGDFASSFLLTITNPMTIFSYLTIFASLGLSNQASDHSNATKLIGGVFIGSALWWFLLSRSVTLFRKRVTPNTMKWTNRLGGIVIIGFGMTAIVSKLF